MELLPLTDILKGIIYIGLTCGIIAECISVFFSDKLKYSRNLRAIYILTGVVYIGFIFMLLLTTQWYMGLALIIITILAWMGIIPRQLDGFLSLIVLIVTAGYL